MLRYKIDILASLKDAGYSTYKLYKDKVFGQGTIQNFRDGKIVSPNNIDKLCQILDIQPGDLIEYVKE